MIKKITVFCFVVCAACLHGAILFPVQAVWAAEQGEMERCGTIPPSAFVDATFRALSADRALRGILKGEWVPNHYRGDDCLDVYRDSFSDNDLRDLCEGMYLEGTVDYQIKKAEDVLQELMAKMPKATAEELKTARSMGYEKKLKESIRLVKDNKAELEKQLAERIEKIRKEKSDN
jgi:hypothetical protein